MRSHAARDNVLLEARIDFIPVIGIQTCLAVLGTEKTIVLRETGRLGCLVRVGWWV